MKFAKIVKHCRIDKPEKFKLADFDPAECCGLSTDIEQVRAILADGVAHLLARLGIVARIRQVEKAGYEPGYHVIVADTPVLSTEYCAREKLKPELLSMTVTTRLLGAVSFPGAVGLSRLILNVRAPVMRLLLMIGT